MLYQRVQLPATNIGAPGPLPPYLVGYADASLANLSAALSPDVCAALGFAGQGFFLVAPVRTISAIAFIQRIPVAKRVAIMRAADAPDYTLQAILQLINAARDGVNLDDADTVNGLAYAQSKGLLTAADVAAIRADG